MMRDDLLDEANLSAEQRLRLAFLRLKENKPRLLPIGTAVSQNNVAKEAGVDTSALRKTRYPSLVREIQAYVELHKNDTLSTRKAVIAARAKRRSDKERMMDAVKQRDKAVSEIASMVRQLITLHHRVKELETELAQLRPKGKLFPIR